jgi:hypothetical protein
MSLSAAARYVKVSEKTGQNWWKNPEVRAEFDGRRQDALGILVGQIQGSGTDAIVALRSLLGSVDEKIRRAAADAILRHVFRATEQYDLIGKLKQLLERMDGVGGGDAEGAGEKGEPDGPPAQPPDALPG